MLSSSIQPIDQVLPFQARVDQGAMTMKRFSAFPKAPALLEPHPGHSIEGGCLTPLQRCSQCILQPQLTRPLVGGDVLPLCRDAVCVFCSPSQLGWKRRRNNSDITSKEISLFFLFNGISTFLGYEMLKPSL